MVTLSKNSDKHDDRRHSNRMPYPMDMRYRSSVAAGLGTIVDLSSNGMFFETLESLKAGDRLHIDFQFRNSRAAMEICGEITRTTPSGVGVRFLW